MTTETMTSILGKINGQMAVAKRKIILFMDNAPCHPESLSEQYSNIKVVFTEEEFENLVKELSTEVFAAEYIDFDREVVISQPSIDVKNIAWRQESRQNANDTVMGYHNDQEHLKDA